MDTKVCFTCGEEKPLTDFYKNKSKKDGFDIKCKNCASEYAKENNKKNLKLRRQSNKYREWLKKYRQSEHYIQYKKEYMQRESSMNYRSKNCNENSRRYKQSEKGKQSRKNYEATDNYFISKTRSILKKELGFSPPSELVEIKLLILKTKRLCKTSKNLESV